VQVWRKLRSLGALCLQQSVCLLPARDEVMRQVRRLADRVRRQGGSCRLLHVGLADEAERARLVAELNAARDEEYGEVLKRLPEFAAELDKQRARGRTTYAKGRGVRGGPGAVPVLAGQGRRAGSLRRAVRVGRTGGGGGGRHRTGRVRTGGAQRGGAIRARPACQPAAATGSQQAVTAASRGSRR